MSKKSKAYQAAAEKVDRDKLYSPLEAAALAKETGSANYDATVEVAIRLGVDPRKADQMVRGTVNLPHGTVCNAYNQATQDQRGSTIPVEITVYEDRSFTFVLKTPPAAKLLLKAAGVAKGSGEPHKTKVATVTMDQVREIAKTKQEDLNANDIDQAAKIIAGTARSMGITVEG